jgi:hypothetical protein
MLKRYIIGALMVVTGLLFLRSVSNADSGIKNDSAVAVEEDFNQSLDTYFRYSPSRGAHAQSGSVATMEADSEYKYELKLFDELPVKLSLEDSYIGIENTTDVELPARLVGFITDIETTLPFFKVDKTYIRIGISPSFYDDDWNFHSSSFRIPVRSFIIYKPNEEWAFIGGVAVYPDYETKAFPILGFIYQPNDRLSFNIVPKRPNVSYKLNDKLTVFAEAGMSYEEYEVTKDDLKNVVLRFKEDRLGTGIKYKFNKFIESSVTVGGVFNRSLKYRDSLGKVDIKSGFYSEFRVEIKI